MGEEISGGGQEAVEASQASVETPEVPSQPQGQGDKGPGPWQKDLESLGLGEYQQVVDQYLREKWQPRVTELEQQYAPYKDTFQSPEDGAAAAQLLYQLRQDPHTTYAQLGEMIKEAFPDLEEASDESDESSEQPDPRQEFIDQLMQERELAASQAEYDKIVEGYRKDAPDLDEQWFAKLVVANNGDTDAALADYKQLFADQFQKPEPPPPTIGSGSLAPQETEEFDGDLEALVRKVTRRANAKN